MPRVWQQIWRRKIVEGIAVTPWRLVWQTIDPIDAALMFVRYVMSEDVDTEHGFTVGAEPKEPSF